MNEHDEPGHDMSDEAAEEVRRLLADARETAPMPADVQARLDAVLSDLSSERATRTPAAVVVDLSSRRRRRAKALLIAAAAVTVIGVGAPRVFSDLSGQNAMTSNDSAADTSAGGAGEGTDSGSGALETDPEAPTEDAPNAEADSLAAPPQVRPQAFAADAQAARDLAARSGLTAFTPLDPNCLAGADLLEQLKSIPVRYGRQDGALVLGKTRNGSQKATLYICGESVPRRTTVLPAR